jgi:hypothetical protein
MQPPSSHGKNELFKHHVTSNLNALMEVIKVCVVCVACAHMQRL